MNAYAVLSLAVLLLCNTLAVWKIAQSNVPVVCQCTNRSQSHQAALTALSTLLDEDTNCLDIKGEKKDAKKKTVKVPTGDYGVTVNDEDYDVGAVLRLPPAPGLHPKKELRVVEEDAPPGNQTKPPAQGPGPEQPNAKQQPSIPDPVRHDTVAIVSRSLETLSEVSGLLLLRHPRWPVIRLHNTGADTYIHQLLRLPDWDWLINVDEDFFLSNWTVVYELMREMEHNGEDLLCYPDGGRTPRGESPNSCNPFFNIFRMKSIRKKVDVHSGHIVAGEVASNLRTKLKEMHGSDNPFSPQYRGADRITEQCHPEPTAFNLDSNFEPYYRTFYYLRTRLSIRFICGRDVVIPNTHPATEGWRLVRRGDDHVWIGTALVDLKTMLPYGYHSWFARQGSSPRIRFLFDLAMQQLMEAPPF